MRKKVLFIVNASSGTATGKARLYPIVESLSLKGCLVTALPVIPSKGLIPNELLIGSWKEYDVIACYGGDGTLNRIVDLMLRNHIDKPLAYFPGGSTNDFARSLGGGKIPTEEEICESIALDKRFYYDVGKFNDRYFNYVAAFGIFTSVSYSTPQDLKNLFGYGAYVLSVISEIPDALNWNMPVKVCHDQGVTEGNFLVGSITNSISVGGMQASMIQNSKLNDGLFEVTLIGAPDSLNDLPDLLNVLSKGVPDGKYLITFRTSALRIETEKEVAWTLDGEEAGKSRHAELKVLKERMCLMVPAGKPVVTDDEMERMIINETGN